MVQSKSSQLQVSFFNLFGCWVSDGEFIPKSFRAQIAERVVKHNRIYGNERPCKYLM